MQSKKILKNFMVFRFGFKFIQSYSFSTFLQNFLCTIVSSEYNSYICSPKWDLIKKISNNESLRNYRKSGHCGKQCFAL